MEIASEVTLTIHFISAQNDLFGSPEGFFLAKNLETKVFSVHTIRNLTFWNPNVAPQKVENFGPTDPPLTPPRGPKMAKFLQVH